MPDSWLNFLPALLVLAFFAATVFAAARTLPTQNVVALAFLIATISGLVQILGAKTGIPFGPFFYTENLGHVIYRGLPWPVPLIWVVFILNSRGVARLILRPWREKPNYGYWSSGLTCLLAVLLDGALEPVARANRFWLWQLSKTLPTWYGAPLVNFAAWAAVTLLILGIILPWLIDKKSGHQSPPAYPPLLLWLLLMLVLTVASAVHSYWLAVGFNVAITVPVSLVAWRNSRR